MLSKHWWDTAWLSISNTSSSDCISFSTFKVSFGVFYFFFFSPYFRFHVWYSNTWNILWEWAILNGSKKQHGNKPFDPIVFDLKMNTCNSYPTLHTSRLLSFFPFVHNVTEITGTHLVYEPDVQPWSVVVMNLLECSKMQLHVSMYRIEDTPGRLVTAQRAE